MRSVLQVPANLMLKKLSARIWLSSITVAWGIVRPSSSLRRPIGTAIDEIDLDRS